MLNFLQLPANATKVNVKFLTSLNIDKLPKIMESSLYTNLQLNERIGLIPDLSVEEELLLRRLLDAEYETLSKRNKQ